MAAQRAYGNKWALVARLFSGRTDNAVKNQWHVLMANRQREQSGAFRRRSKTASSSSSVAPLSPHYPSFVLQQHGSPSLPLHHPYAIGMATPARTAAANESASTCTADLSITSGSAAVPCFYRCQQSVRHGSASARPANASRVRLERALRLLRPVVLVGAVVRYRRCRQVMQIEEAGRQHNR